MAGFTLDWRSSSGCHSACGIAWHHRWSGNVVAVPLKTPMNWYFHVCWWSSYSAIWNVIPVAKISSLWALDISSSNTWCLSTMSRSCICHIILRRATIKSPSVLLLVVSMSVQYLSILLATTWYCFPRLDWTRNFLVWLVYIFFGVMYGYENILFLF